MTPRKTTIIVGNGRSGTNWLLTLLDASVHTHCRNEPHLLSSSGYAALPSEPDMSLEPQSMAIAWKEFRDRCCSRIGERDLRLSAPKTFLHPWTSRSGIAALSSRPKVRRLLQQLPSGIRGEQWPLPWWLGSQSRLLDSAHVLKVNDFRSWHVNWILDNEPETLVIHIVRHPGGYLNSAIKRFFATLDAAQMNAERHIQLSLMSQAIAAGKLQLDHSLDVEAMPTSEIALWNWAYNNSQIFQYGKGKPSYRFVLYEDLVQRPLELAAELYQSVGLPMDAPTMARIKAGLGSSVWGDIKGSPQDVASAWKKQLNAEEQALCEKVLAQSAFAGLW